MQLDGLDFLVNYKKSQQQKRVGLSILFTIIRFMIVRRVLPAIQPGKEPV